MRASFIVSFELPPGADREDAMSYIGEAVSSWKGCLHPDEDPMFNLDYRTVRVTRRTRRKVSTELKL